MDRFIGRPSRNTSGSDTSIRVDHVSKKFRVYLDKGSSLKERALFRERNRYEERKVLRDISFTVKKGEAIGLIGENGCGKSTTLKLLSRIMYPDSGSIDINGRVSALIELGAGFHPDLSGRENIYTNAAIFGLNGAEIDRRLQTIIDFSELGDYIDNPVRTYSSGMYMRLAFSVAINVDADVLLVDEILAVGDVAFQAKCFDKMREIKSRGTTIVIVSHALSQIEQICDTSYWIDGGLIRAKGNPMDVHQQYLEYMSQRSGVLSHAAQAAPAPEQPAPQPPAEKPKRWGSREVRFETIELQDGKGNAVTQLQSGAPFRIVMRYRVEKPVQDIVFGIGLFRNDGLNCYGVNTRIDQMKIRLEKERGQVIFEAPRNDLIEGEYLLDVAIHRPDGFSYDHYRECIRFTVSSAVKDIGVMRLNHKWIID